MWELNAQKKRESDNRFNISDMSKVPQPLTNTDGLQHLIRLRLLPESFYEYFICSSNLYTVLSKSKYFEDYNARFHRQFQVKKIVTPPQTPQNNIENRINPIVSRIQLLKPSFNRNQIAFQELDSTECYYSSNNKFYFSHLLFQNPQRLEEFIFEKCLVMLGISVSTLLEKFRLVPR